MENPFAKFSQKDWLYTFGAAASVVALAFLVISNKINGAGGGVITDVQNNQTPDIGSGEVNYVNYNTAPYNAPVPAGADVAPNPANTPAGCGCPSDCAGNGALATGDTFSGVDALLNYYTQTNPIYVQLQQAQLARYAAYFATGESYSKGGIALGVSAQG